MICSFTKVSLHLFSFIFTEYFILLVGYHWPCYKQVGNRTRIDNSNPLNCRSRLSFICSLCICVAKWIRCCHYKLRIVKLFFKISRLCVLVVGRSRNIIDYVVFHISGKHFILLFNEIYQRFSSTDFNR